MSIRPASPGDGRPRNLRSSPRPACILGPSGGANGGEGRVNPSDLDRRNPGEGVPGGDGSTHANGPLEGGDQWLRSVLQNSSEIVKVVDRDGTLRYANPAFGRVLGYDPGETVGTMNVLDHVHPEDLARVLEETEKALSAAGTGTNVVEYRFKHKDGSWRWIEGAGIYLTEDLAVRGVVVNARDVTERKEAETGLREAEEKYRTLVEQIPAVTYIDRADGSFESLYTSPQIEGMLGYTPEEWLTQKLWEKRLHPDDRERILAADERLEVRGEPFSEEYRLLAKDGSVVWVHEEALLVRGAENEPLFWQGVIHDVTERKEAEENLRRSKASLSEAQRLAHLGSWEWDVETGEVRWSDETFRIYGFEPGGTVPTLGKLMEVVHPDDREMLEAAISAALNEHEPYDLEHRVVRPGGEVRVVHRRAEVVLGEEGGLLRMIGTVHDITERKILEERLEHQAFHDPLTGLPNRQLFLDRLGQALRRTKRRQDRQVAVLFMDLNNFKSINDSLGHEIGDLLLVVVAERLRRNLRPGDTLARFGGDEFIVLLEDVGDPDEAVRVAERITEGFKSPFSLEGQELYGAASIGVALGEDRTKSPDDLLRDADTAMYRAKAEGGGFRMFDSAMYERAINTLEVENDLRRAVEREEFVVHYQPIVRLDGGTAWGVEALVRWEHPERGLLDPGEFVPIAEESGLVVPMGTAVMEEACRRARGWKEDHPHVPPLVLSVNLSARQLARPDLAETVEGVLRKTGLEARSLSLDVTETVYTKALEVNTLALARLKNLGVGISIDDFGMGYSSLFYLKRLPADVLKIDQAFVKGLGEDVEDTAIVRMVIQLAHTLGIKVVAEGVEDGEQAALLAEMGCDLAQGFYFSRPLPPEGVPGFLA